MRCYYSLNVNRHSLKSVAIAAILSFAVTALTQNVPSSGTDKESSTEHPFRSSGSSAYVRATDGALVTDNNSFVFANVLHDDGSGYVRLLLLKTEHNEHIDGQEDTKGRVAVRAWTIGRRGARTEKWHMTTTGNEGQALSDQRFFVVTQWGCCDSPNIYTYFGLLSGKKLYVANSELLEAVVLDSGPQGARYVALGYDRPGASPVLQYGSDTRVKQRFSLLLPPDSNKMAEVFITVGTQRGKSVSLSANERLNFTIVVKYADVELRIPVRADAIRADEANLPNGYTLRAEVAPNER